MDPIHGITLRLDRSLNRVLLVHECYSAWVFDADRRAKLLMSLESAGSKFGAE